MTGDFRLSGLGVSFVIFFFFLGGGGGVEGSGFMSLGVRSHIFRDCRVQDHLGDYDTIDDINPALSIIRNPEYNIVPIV